MKLLFIEASNGEVFKPIIPETQDPKCWEGIYLPVCYIKELSRGRFQIDYSEMRKEEDGYYTSDNQIPNTRLILYPSGIKRIKYKTI